MSKEKSQIGECEWRHAPEASAEDFGGFEKSHLSWELDSERKGLTFACSPKPDQWPCGGCHTCWGVGSDGKASIKRLCLSPYVEEPLNSNIIKSFVPELRSRKCFSCFGIPIFYVYVLWTFYVRFTYPYLAMVHVFLFNFFSILNWCIFVDVVNIPGSRNVCEQTPSKRKVNSTWY